MRGKRSKQYRKLMHQYQLTFSFREPYQVLLTADIILAAHRYRMNLGSLLSSTLHGQIKPMITQCCIRHLYDLPSSPEKDTCISVAKEAERRRCGHHELEEPLTALECVVSVVDGKGSGTNKHKYVVATQEREVRERMRAVEGVPLVYINKSVMILEPMAERSIRLKDGEEKAKIRAGLKSSRRAIGEKRKMDEGDGDGMNESEGAGHVEDGPARKKKKIQGPKGPNPLSVKKSKKDQGKHKSLDDERIATRKALNADPQAKAQALGTRMLTDEAQNGISEGQRKRKRKRKAKDGDAGAELAGLDATQDD